MSWNNIKQWFANMIPSSGDFNRIEGNTLDNHNRLDGHDSDISSINSTLSNHDGRISSNDNRLDNIEDGSLTKILGKQVEWVEYTFFNVLSSFASPGSNPQGLTYDGSNLWNVNS